MQLQMTWVAAGLAVSKARSRPSNRRSNDRRRLSHESVGGLPTEKPSFGGFYQQQIASGCRGKEREVPGRQRREPEHACDGAER